jgi:acyl-CoA oxidase
MSDFTNQLKPAHDGTAMLQAERDGSAISVRELARHLLARDGFLERQERVLEVLSREKLFDKSQQLNLSRPERYHLGLARAKAIQRIIRREGWDHEDYKMAEYLNDEMSPYFLHMSMFGQYMLFVEPRRQADTATACNSYHNQGTSLDRATSVLDA